MKKNEVKHIIKLSVFLFVLGLICTTILSIVNYITKEPIEANNQKALEEETKVITDKLSSINVENIVNITELNSDNLITETKTQVEQIFTGIKDAKQVLAFKIYSENDFVEFNTLVVLIKDGEEYVVDDVMVLSDATSFGSSANNKFYNNNFNLKDAKESEINSKFEIVAGTTYSSKSVKQACLYAYNQIAKGVKINEEN